MIPALAALWVAATPLTFEQACANPRLRAAYVNQVTAAAPRPPYVTSIEVVPRERVRAVLPPGVPVPGMLTLSEGKDPRPWRGGQSSKIYVFPAAFDPALVDSELVFLLGLLDHERVHAQLAHDGVPSNWVRAAEFEALPRSSAAWLYNVLSELVAYDNELRQANRYNVSARYRRQAYGAFLSNYLQLWSTRRRVPPSVRYRLMAAFFQKWMLETPSLLQRTDRRWWLQSDGGKYLFPESVRLELQTRFGS